MKTTLRIEIPEISELVADLDPATCYRGLPKAQRAVTDAAAALEDARQRLAAATELVDELPAKVRRGKADQAQLEQAIARQRACELMTPQYEKAVDEARGALVEAQRQAAAASVEEARRRRDQLQAIADKLEPILEALAESELALHDALREVAPEPQGDPVALVEARKLAPPLAPLKWPVCLQVRREQAVGRFNVPPLVRRAEAVA